MKVRRSGKGGGAGDEQGPNWSSGGGASGPGWSMSSLLEVLPDSPSPICSSTTTSSMDFSSEFFTPSRQQNGLGGSKLAEATSEVQGSVLGRRDVFFFLPSDSTDKWKQECSSPTARKSMSTLYESTLTTMDRQDPNPSKTQKHQYEELICEGSSSQETPTLEEFHSRMSRPRPRPYQEFLDEVQTHQHCSEIEAWKKAKQLKLQTKLRRKEASITNWEMEQKNKARAEMEIIERKIEVMRAKALKKIQKKIVQANKAAEKQRAHERRAALNKMARVAKLSEKIQATKCMIFLKLRKL